MSVKQANVSDVTAHYFSFAAQQIESAVERELVPWAVLIVLKDGQEVFAHAAGTDVDHVDVLRSATKLATVTAVMTLVENGAISLEDPVQRYVPAFPCRLARPSRSPQTVTRPARYAPETTSTTKGTQ